MIAALASIAVILVVPLLFVGLVGRVKAVWAGRQGPPVLQPWRDFWKLLQKGEVVSTTTSFVFMLAPPVILAAVLAAAMVTPLVAGVSMTSFQGDFVVFSYFLALARLFQVLMALDTGSSFEGMGASREVTFSALVEPAFFLILGSLAAFTGLGSFAAIQAAIVKGGVLSPLLMGLGGLAFFIMLAVEGARMPVDDPLTHLELTMIHEVMVLDNSGPGLAFIQFATALRMVLVGGLVAAMVLPPSLPLWLSGLGFLGVLSLLALTVGTVESVLARLRMSHVPQFVLFMLSLGLIILGFVEFAGGAIGG